MQQHIGKQQFKMPEIAVLAFVDSPLEILSCTVNAKFDGPLVFINDSLSIYGRQLCTVLRTGQIA